MGRWVRVDRRYNQPYRLTGYAHRAVFKWTGLVIAWAFVNSWLDANHLSLLILATTGGMIWYGVHCVRRNHRPQLAKPSKPQLAEPSNQWIMPTTNEWPVNAQSTPTAGGWQFTAGAWQFNVPPMPTVGLWKFNVPPNWPAPPAGWSPEPGWQPEPSWPAPPYRWHFWAPDEDMSWQGIPAEPTPRGAPGERNSRVIPQNVKIAVSVRDQGKCVQCGSTDDLHFDHKVPWSRGGTNSINNIQLLCGLCNRRKGADDIPF